jgi:hypothetical protein
MTTKADLTSAEIANLWSAYIDNNAMVTKFKYVFKIMEDTEILPIIEKANEFSKNNLKQLKQIFESEDFAVPLGFTNADVDEAAPRLFSDTIFLDFLQKKMNLNLNAYSMALTHTTRIDIRSFFNQCLIASIQLFNEATDLMLSKGIYTRPPIIPTPDTVDMTERQSFLTGWFGSRRPLTAMEISHLFFNINRNALGQTLLMGYSQVAKAKEVRDYMRRGADIAKKNIEIFSSVLMDEGFPPPMIWSSKIEDTTVSPFSDKFLMNEVSLITQAGVAFYGRSLALAQRHDLGSHYLRIMAESLQYGEDGAKILIKHAWLEEPPQMKNFRKR